MNQWRSFRLRLALTLSVSGGVVLVGLGALVERQLQRVIEREEATALQLLATQVPAALRGSGRRSGPPALPDDWTAIRDGQAVLVGFVDQRKRWLSLRGTWPEFLQGAVLGEHVLLFEAGEDWDETFWGRSEESVFAPPPPSPPPPPLGGVEGLHPAWPTPPAPPSPGFAPPGRQLRMERLSGPELSTMRFGRLDDPENAQTWRVGVVSYRDGSLWLAREVTGEDRARRAFRQAWFGLMPLSLLLLVGLSWAIATRALRPVRRLTEAMGGISERTLGVRLAATEMDREFVPLIERFNVMLERLERSFAQASRFSADAAHELRTPLTILQGELEAAIQQAPAGSEEQARAASLLDEIGRLRQISERLLLLAKADAGRLLESTERLDLDHLLQEEMELAQEMAPELEVTWQGEHWPVQADPALLRQAIRNLLTNALKYNLERGFIEAEWRVTAARGRLRMRNAARPLSAAVQARLFERFARGDAARQRATEGLGLGLSLAREIVRAHGGELWLESSTETGTEFVLELPLALASEV